MNRGLRGAFFNSGDIGDILGEFWGCLASSKKSLYFSILLNFGDIGDIGDVGIILGINKWGSIISHFSNYLPFY